jgi:CBS domain-containing protein
VAPTASIARLLPCGLVSMTMPTARDLMERNALTVPASMPYPEIVRLLVVAGVHGAPVVDEHGAIVGVISVMDLLRAGDQAHDDDRDEGEDGEDGDPTDQLLSTTAMQLASPDPTWVSGDASAAEVARLMRDEGIHRVLVGTDGRLEGIVTPFDLLRVVGESVP